MRAGFHARCNVVRDVKSAAIKAFEAKLEHRAKTVSRFYQSALRFPTPVRGRRVDFVDIRVLRAALRSSHMTTSRIVFRALLALTLAIAATGITPVQAQGAASGAQRNKVVIQVSDNDPGKWNLALNNAKNLQTDLGAANVDIEIVAYGPGLGMLKAESPVGSRIDEASLAGVKILACENTMKGQKLTPADMHANIGYVGAGVVEIMTRQQQGWAYIRP